MRKSLFSVVLFFSFFVLNAQNPFYKKVLATIGNHKVTVGSFLNIYSKNNLGNHDTVSIKKAVNLYINFRLKVMEAENRKMDTLASFKTELAGYRNQLIKPYFQDKKVEDSLIHQAYQRSLYDLRVSHILVKLPPYPSPADTLKAWNKIEKIRKEILNGESFKQAAIKYSDDPSARNQKAIPGIRPARKGNGGDLGYFTVFDLVYPFESAAYNTPVGQISQPVRTRFGYHLIKVTAKRPAMGIAQVEHIFIPLRPGASKADSLRKVKEINVIYQKIKQGMPFEKAAKLYSQDKGSSYIGGRLPKFTAGRIVPQFVEQVDSLKPGQVSKPFQTIYGFHIIKLLSREKPGNFKQEEASIKNKLAANQRSRLIKQAVIKKLKKEDYLKVYKKYKEQIFNELIEKLGKGKLKADSLKNQDAPLIKIGRKNSQTFKQSDFARFVEKNQRKLDPKGYWPLEISKLFGEFTDEKLIAYEKMHLGEHHPGFRELMQEYHDGILLFNLTNKMVWSKATQDTIGLKNYYAEHQSRYRWKPRVQAVILKTSRQKVNKLKAELQQYKNPDSLKRAIAQKKIPGFANIAVDSGYFEKGDDTVTDQVKWVKGISKPVFEKGNNYADIVWIENILPAGQKSFRDAKGLVIADYQDLLQKHWVEYLRKKYPVHINQKVLKKLEKKYPVKK